jgi:hypothetical protein
MREDLQSRRRRTGSCPVHSAGCISSAPHTGLLDRQDHLPSIPRSPGPSPLTRHVHLSFWSDSCITSSRQALVSTQTLLRQARRCSARRRPAARNKSKLRHALLWNFSVLALLWHAVARPVPGVVRCTSAQNQPEKCPHKGHGRCTAHVVQDLVPLQSIAITVKRASLFVLYYLF